jgi:hypothetical protein
MLAAALLTVVCDPSRAAGYTESEVDELFKAFDTQTDGKVTRTEFDFLKVRIIYRNTEIDPIAGIPFDRTKLSRRYFDSLDTDRNGRLTPIEIIDGLRFDNVSKGNPDYFTREELGRFLASIGQ